jgi:ABC-type amino acid transport substrate-binding protein
LVLAVRSENSDVKDFETLYDSGIKLAPILAGNGMFYVVRNYNEENPDKAIDITTTDDSTFVAGSIEELVAGKYDAILWTKPQFDSTVVAEDGENHSLLDKVSYSEFTTVNTYPMFSKSVGEDFVKEFSDALKEVKDSGKASEISNTYFGYDIWNYDFE